MQKLDMLDVNKNRKFLSPLADNLVRTGTIGEGSCFFHSIYHAISPEYRKMDEDERMEYVAEERERIANSIQIDKWQSEGGEAIAMVPFSMILRYIIELFINFLGNTQKYINIKSNDPTINFIYENFFVDMSIDTYKYLFGFLDIESFEMLISGVIHKNLDKNKSIDDFIYQLEKDARVMLADNILKRSKSEEIDKSRLREIFEALSIFIEKIGSSSKNMAFKNFVKSIGNCNAYVDEFLMETIMDSLGLDIYILDGQTRLPYKTTNYDKYYKNRKSIIIIWINENHYEIVGEIQSDGSVKRLFKPSDELIQTIKDSVAK